LGLDRHPVTRVSYRKHPILESLYIGMPWTELDYMLAVNTSAPIYVQLKEQFPEVEAVNAFYTHGLLVIVSTRRLARRDRESGPCTFARSASVHGEAPNQSMRPMPRHCRSDSELIPRVSERHGPCRRSRRFAMLSEA
jgi:hypothetical protein